MSIFRPLFNVAYIYIAGGAFGPPTARRSGGYRRRHVHGICRTALSIVAKAALARYLEEIRQFPMLEPQEEYMLAKRWREHGDRDAAHQLVTSPSAARRQDRHGLSRLWPADRRGDLRRQCRPDAGGEALRARQGLPARDLCHVVDQGVDPGIHPALVVAREDGHHGQPEEAVLQPAQGQEPDLGARRGRSAPRSGEADRDQARRDRAGRRRHEPAARRRRLAQRARSARARARASGRTGWSTTSASQETVLAEPRRATTATTRCAMRSACSTRASGASSRRAGWPRIRSRWRSFRRVRRLPRARPPDRGARLREGAKGGEKRLTPERELARPALPVS